jgi:rhodanese-related sulfurtransferase
VFLGQEVSSPSREKRLLHQKGFGTMAVREIDAQGAFALLESEAVLIDVRQPGEWDAGHAPMATLIPLAELPDHLDELPKDRVIVCVCRSGARSLRAATFLDEQGFEAVNLTGGMLAWFADALPLESDDGEPSIA